MQIMSNNFSWLPESTWRANHAEDAGHGERLAVLVSIAALRAGFSFTGPEACCWGERCGRLTAGPAEKPQRFCQPAEILFGERRGRLGVKTDDRMAFRSTQFQQLCADRCIFAQQAVDAFFIRSWPEGIQQAARRVGHIAAKLDARSAGIMHAVVKELTPEVFDEGVLYGLQQGGLAGSFFGKICAPLGCLPESHAGDDLRRPVGYIKVEFLSQPHLVHVLSAKELFCQMWIAWKQMLCQIKSGWNGGLGRERFPRRGLGRRCDIALHDIRDALPQFGTDAEEDLLGGFEGADRGQLFG
jgi:hypothetical protein